MKRHAAVFGICLLAVAVGALALRLPRLALRPMHADEANQAVKTGELFDDGTYRYDPGEHHGPSLYYLTLPSLWLGQARTFAETDEFQYRIVPAIFGVALVLLLWPLRKGLGMPAAVCAGVLTALSPAMVFYSRYYVQEMLLVFFTAGAIVSAWRYTQTKSAAWAVAAGVSIGLMHATKETWVLAGAAMVAGLVLTHLWARLRDGRGLAFRECLRWRPLVLGIAAAIIVACLLFSSFGANWRGPLDSLLSYTSYAGKAGENGIHTHAWYFYLAMLICDHPARGFTWTEGLIVGLAIVGFVAALRKNDIPDAHRPLVRFLGFYTLALTAAYAMIPYKTPWCMLSFLHGMILLAGVGAVALVRWMPCRWSRGAMCLVLAALAVHLGWESYQLNFRYYADQRNPYNYPPTSTDGVEMARLVERVAAVAPDGREMIIKVITPENYWPLPWYLRKFDPDHIGWYHEMPANPDDPPASVMIVAKEVQEELDARLRGPYFRTGMFGLRPSVLMVVYVQDGLWQKFVASQEPKAAGGKQAERQP